MHVARLALIVAPLVATAVAYSPTGGYAPGSISCPDVESLVRAATSISEDEEAWLKVRHAVTDVYLASFLERVGLEYDLSALNRSINIGLAFSGGGYRAMLNGAGQLAALDERVDGANEHGLGGLLQASTYFAGLSGGNWLTGSLALNNWTSVQDIIDGQADIWDLTNTILTSGGLDVLETFDRWEEIGDAVDEKTKAGFETTVTDVWGRALSYQFFSTNNAEEGLAFSDIRNFPVFQNGSMPFPLSIAIGRTPGTTVISLNSTVFEFNPFELGSWDPSLYAFTDLKYIGSELSNGVPTGDQCIAGFDNAGFVLGTSSSLFNEFLTEIESASATGTTAIIYDLVEVLLEALSVTKEDIAMYSPNPFYETTYAEVDSIVTDKTLYLVDGGEDYQNIPFQPLIQPERQVDVVFAFDSSDNTDDTFPDGTALISTYERQFYDQANRTAFPYVPGQATFLKHNLTSKPTFFGCYASNLTDLTVVPPLVVYVPNIAYSAWSNTSTFKMAYDTEFRNALIQNGFEGATRYNLTIDQDWPLCVGCAIIQRSLESTGEGQSDECKACFDEYCWDGSLYEGTLDVEDGYWSNNHTNTTDIGDADDGDDLLTLIS